MTDATDLLALADECVKCGLCLPHCPTFRLTGDESESPRGRIALIQARFSGQLPPSRQLDAHLDHCLLCRACEPACPSLVSYGKLMDGARTLRLQQRYGTRNRLARLPLDLLSEPRLLPFMWASASITGLLGQKLLRRLQRGKGTIAVLAGLLQQLHRPRSVQRDRRSGTGSGVSLFLGCVARSLTPDTAASATRVLEHLGFQVQIPADQGCCGALHRHQGHARQADTLLTQNLQAFDPGLPVIGFASACVAELQSHASHPQQQPRISDEQDPAERPASLDPGLDRQRQGRDSERQDIDARELCRYLADTHWPDALQPRPLEASVAIHLPCSQRNQLRDPNAARDLLSRIPGLRLTELHDNALCCGAAGAHLLQHAETAITLADAKIAGLRELRPDYLVTTNTGCAALLQARLAAADLEIEVLHPVDLLARQL